METFNVGYKFTHPFDATQDYEGGVDVKAFSHHGAKDIFFEDHSRDHYEIQFVMDRVYA